jgi:hypothetical protein
VLIAYTFPPFCLIQQVIVLGAIILLTLLLIVFIVIVVSNILGRHLLQRKGERFGIISQARNGRKNQQTQTRLMCALAYCCVISAVESEA